MRTLHVKWEVSGIHRVSEYGMEYTSTSNNSGVLRVASHF